MTSPIKYLIPTTTKNSPIVTIKLKLAIYCNENKVSNMEKGEIINSFYTINCTATSTAVDSRVSNNDYFKRRILGFKAEIEFEELINGLKGVKFFEGGQFISKRLTGESQCRNEFIYITISFDRPNEYMEIYNLVGAWKEVKKCYFLQIIPKNWSTSKIDIRKKRGGTIKKTKVLKPNLKFYIFNKEKSVFELCPDQSFKCILSAFNKPGRSPSVHHLRKREQFDYFKTYEKKVLMKIYANRYFLDYELRNAQGRQIIDLDGFIKKHEKIIAAEVKEKSPIKDNSNSKSDWRYGWDSRRILWYLYIARNLNIDILYSIRQIDDRESRNFVQWDSLLLTDFLCGVSWSNSRGGGGGEDTLLAPYLFFSETSELIRNL